MSGAHRLSIAVDFDLVCPWCFIGKRQLDRARDRFARHSPDVVVETTWNPVQLLPEIPDDGVPFAAFYERRLGSALAMRQRIAQVTQAAFDAGIVIDLRAIARMPNTARAHRLLRRVARLGKPQLYEALLDRLFAAYFQHGEDIGDPATLRTIAAGFGVHADPRADMPAELPPGPGRPGVGVPHYVFDGRQALSGARDAETLYAVMRWATQPAVEST